MNEYGKPFTANHFTRWFAARCQEANLPHCTPHGLRKAGAVRATEDGATVNQLMALFDWLSPVLAGYRVIVSHRCRVMVSNRWQVFEKEA